MFAQAHPRGLPSYGGDGKYGYSHHPSSKRGAAGSSVAVWVMGLLLVAATCALGWGVHSAKQQLEELKLHTNVLEQHLLNEKASELRIYVGCYYQAAGRVGSLCWWYSSPAARTVRPCSTHSGLVEQPCW